LADKITSIRVNEEIWRKAKILAARRGITLRSLIEGLLKMEIEAEELLKEESKISEEHIKVLEERRRRGEVPFIILSERTAVELVKEGRGD